MREDGHTRIVERLEDALGLLRSRQIELAVHRGDHDVELGQDRVGQIEGAVLEDVHLDAREHRDSRQAPASASSISAICLRNRTGSRPWATVRRCECSVMAM